MPILGVDMPMLQGVGFAVTRPGSGPRPICAVAGLFGLVQKVVQIRSIWYADAPLTPGLPDTALGRERIAPIRQSSYPRSRPRRGQAVNGRRR